MKPYLIPVALLALAAYLVLKPSALDKLSERPRHPPAVPAGNIFVTASPSVLPVSPRFFAEPGVITIVFFHDITCSGCGAMDRDLEDFSRLRPDVAVRKVRISLNGNAYYDAIRDYRWPIYLMPCILIYDRDGKLIAADKATNAAGNDLMNQWMSREAERAAEAGL